MDKNPGFTSVKSNTAMDQNLGDQNSLEEALKRKRQKMALKKGVDILGVTDPMGNPAKDPIENEGT